MRQRRRERRDGWAAGRFRLNPKRDPLILYAIGRSKVLPTRDIATLAFGSRETARDRLRKLHCAGLVRAHVRDLANDNLYTLTPSGRAVAVDHFGVEPEQLSVVRRLPKQLDHLMGINRMRICLTVASRLVSYAPLRAFVAEWELRARGTAPLVPDAILKLADRNGVRHFLALEVDLGSENPTYVSERKLKTYARHVALGQPVQGVEIELVVLVAPGVRRLRSLARAIERAKLHLPIALGELDRMTPENVLISYARPSELLDTTRAPDEIFVRPLLP